MPNIRFKDIYDYSKDDLLDEGKYYEYLDYLKSLQPRVTDVADKNQLSITIGKLTTELNKENYYINKTRNLHGEEGVERYKFVNAIESGRALYGNKYFDKFKDASDKLGSELDDDGNITKQATSLAFTFDEEYDFNNFLDATGYNLATLKNNGIVYGKKDGKHYITVDKGNSNFVKVLKGINDINTYQFEDGFWGNIVKGVGKIGSEIGRNLSLITNNIVDVFANTSVYNPSYNIGKTFKNVYKGNKHVTMSSFDKDGNSIDKRNTDTDSWFNAIGDYMLSDYKASKNILSDVEEDELVTQQIQRLGYLTYNESKARDYLNKTGDYKNYNNWITEEYRRADNEIMSTNFADYQIYSDINGETMEEVSYKDIPAVEDIIKNAISEGGDTNSGRRVTYETAMLGTDAGLYITISPKSNKNKISDDADDIQNVLPGRTFFIKGMLDSVTQEAINRKTEWRAYKEVEQMTQWNYDFYFEDGTKITNCNNYSATYFDNYGRPKQINKTEMQSLINKEFAYQDAKTELIALYNDAMSSNSSKIRQKQVEQNIDNLAEGICYQIVSESFPNLLPEEYKRTVLELKFKLLKDIGININNK